MTETAQTPNPITTIEQAGAHAGGTVTIRGWLYNMRESGKLLFPIFATALAPCREWYR
jgi:asparaginyl-tRNA synthetase